MAVDFAIIGSLVRPGRPRYPVLVHRAATLLPVFFSPHLGMMPLRFANPSPPTGWIEDFHLQAVVQYSAHQKGPRSGARASPAAGSAARAWAASLACTAANRARSTIGTCSPPWTSPR